MHFLLFLVTLNAVRHLYQMSAVCITQSVLMQILLKCTLQFKLAPGCARLFSVSRYFIVVASGNDVVPAPLPFSSTVCCSRLRPTNQNRYSLTKIYLQVQCKIGSHSFNCSSVTKFESTYLGADEESLKSLISSLISTANSTYGGRFHLQHHNATEEVSRGSIWPAPFILATYMYI